MSLSDFLKNRALVPATGTGGTQGLPGMDGKSIRYGTAAPAAGLGNDGDFYINTSTSTLYGPRAGGAWPAGVSLIGPQGPQGLQGLQGLQGIQGIQGLQGLQGPAGSGTGGAAVTDIPFSTAISLSSAGTAYMAPATVSAPLTFTAGAGAVRGALVYLRLTADGVNAPNFSAFKEWGGSSGYDNRNGIANQVQFFCDGVDLFYTASQAVGATAISPSASAVTLTGPTSGIVNNASSAFTVGTNAARTAAVVVTPTAVTGVTFNPTSVTLPIGSATATFTATPSTTGTKTIAVTNDSGLTNPASITYTVSASATAPAQMAAPVATQTGATTASVVLSAPSDGGSAITGYTAVSNPPGGVDSNAGTTALTHNMTGLTTGQAYTFTATATNPIGTSPASPASNSVTPTAAAAGAYPRFTSLTGLTETGTGPYTYIGTDAGTAANQQACANKTLGAAGVDGSLSFKLEQVAGNNFTFGLQSTGPTYQPLANMVCTFTVTGGVYTIATTNSGTNAGANMAPAEGDIVRLSRVGTAIRAEVARAATPTTFVLIGSWPSINAIWKYFNLLVSSDAKVTLLDAVGLV